MLKIISAHDLKIDLDSANERPHNRRGCCYCH
jgi:hypothetical protein